MRLRWSGGYRTTQIALSLFNTSGLDRNKNTFPSDIRNRSTIDNTDWFGQKEWDSASQLDYLDYFTYCRLHRKGF